MISALKKTLLTAVAIGTLSGCSTLMESREVTADRIARPAFMMERQIPAGDFNLIAWERVRKEGQPANIYIEGDGLAWISPQQASLDPTPQNPVALNLAAMDKSPNVIYLARPCQFSGNKVWGNAKPKWNGGKACPSKYWTDARFAPEVIDSMSLALDEIKQRYKISEFNLIGYSGGATVAALLAADREDVKSFRTVAGNLNHATFTTLHGVTPMEASLNAVDRAADLRFIPQHHYVGGEDQVVPPQVFSSYEQALSPSQCVAYTLVPDAGHEYGWVDKWPELMKKPLGCSDRPQPVDPSQFTPPPQEFIDAGKGKVF
ncbi:MAG: alpha/beta hydrolase [Rhodospirillales bacterium]|nr:alpha/beta hydrolase [Rhodospirillales bacterium]